MPGTRRYWDGSSWSEHVAPDGPPQVIHHGPSAWTITVGILAAALIIGFVIAVVHAGQGGDDAACAQRNVQHAAAGQPLENCGG
jgi:hypothetical protein